jgi:hypothetical protein
VINLLAYAVAVALAANSGAQVPPRPRTYEAAAVSIRLERTACFGSCPIYQVTISGDGAVVYEGTRFVQTLGTERASVDSEEVVSLLDEFLQVRFFDALERYAGSERARRTPAGIVVESMTITDLPSQILTLRLGERVKRVELYDHYPAELGRLPDLVDRVAGTERWVGRKH